MEFDTGTDNGIGQLFLLYEVIGLKKHECYKGEKCLCRKDLVLYLYLYLLLRYLVDVAVRMINYLFPIQLMLKVMVLEA